VVPASSETGTAIQITLPDGVDLHARPAAEFVRTAMRFQSELKLVLGEREVDAKSLLSILALGAKSGMTLKLRADGVDAAAALEALAATVAAFA
jgi:phosphotransferase system HPr (HPr) family protein